MKRRTISTKRKQRSVTSKEGTEAKADLKLQRKKTPPRFNTDTQQRRTRSTTSKDKAPQVSLKPKANAKLQQGGTTSVRRKTPKDHTEPYQGRVLRQLNTKLVRRRHASAETREIETRRTISNHRVIHVRAAPKIHKAGKTRDSPHRPCCRITAIWPLHLEDLLEYIHKTQASLHSLPLSNFLCSMHTTSQQILVGYYVIICNKNFVSCSSVISRKLRQQCVCTPIDRQQYVCVTVNKYHRKHIISRRKTYATSTSNVVKELLHRTHTISLNNHNKLVVYVRYVHTAMITSYTHRRLTLRNICSDRYVCLECLGEHIVSTYCKDDSCRLHVIQLKHFFPNFNIQIGPQLNLWNGFEIKILRSKLSYIHTKNTHNTMKLLMFYRMSTSSNVAATTRKLFEQKTDSIDTLTNSQKRQVNAIVVSSQKNAKGKGMTFQRPPFWLGYHTLNAIACENEEPK